MLFELSVGMALAALVMLGVVFFYMSSQTTWLDGSLKAISQREPGVILGALSDNLHRAASVSVFNSPDSLHQGILLKDVSGTEFFRLWWNAADSLVHEKVGGGSDLGAIGRSKVEAFRFGRADSLVQLAQLQIRTPHGQRIQLASTVFLYNR